MAIIGSRFLALIKTSLGDQRLKVVGAAVLSGVMNTVVVLVLIMATETMGGDDTDFRLLALLALSLTAYALTTRYSLGESMRRATTVVYGAQLRLADKLRHIDLRSFEAMEGTQIYKVLLENSEIIIEAARYLNMAFSSVVMLTGCFVMLALLSPMALLICVVMVSAAVMVYQFNVKKISLAMAETRERESRFLRHLSNLLDGFVQIKMSTPRSDDLFHNYLSARSAEARFMKIKSENYGVQNFVFASSFFMMLLAAVIFVLPQISSVEGKQLSSIVFIVLFALGPLGNVVAMVPSITKAEFAIEALDELEATLDKLDDTRQTQVADPFAGQAFQGLTLRGVSYAYGDNGGKGFRLGPIDLTVRPGETLFLVGGNGSGKSTLLKLMAGLYYPNHGELTLNGVEVTSANHLHYRNLFSILFAEFHLFDRLYGLGQVDETLLRGLLETLGLKGQTDYVDGRFTNLNLSQGQKKRLALLCAYLENKEIFIFDEVAADLDPQFRRYFYETFLAELKARGKTVLAVSHDDRFFHLADRVIKLDYGQIITLD